VRQSNGNIGQQLPQKRTAARFVIRVGVGVQEADGDGFYPLFLVDW
jgi:hypothetical protein